MIYVIGRTRAEADAYIRERGWDPKGCWVIGSADAMRGLVAGPGDVVHLLPRWSERRDADEVSRNLTLMGRKTEWHRQGDVLIG